MVTDESRLTSDRQPQEHRQPNFVNHFQYESNANKLASARKSRIPVAVCTHQLPAYPHVRSRQLQPMCNNSDSSRWSADATAAAGSSSSSSSLPRLRVFNSMHSNTSTINCSINRSPPVAAKSSSSFGSSRLPQIVRARTATRRPDVAGRRSLTPPPLPTTTSMTMMAETDLSSTSVDFTSSATKSLLKKSDLMTSSGRKVKRVRFEKTLELVRLVSKIDYPWYHDRLAYDDAAAVDNANRYHAGTMLQYNNS